MLRRPGITRDHRMLYELAVLSEQQIGNLDEMTGIIDLAEHIAFEKQRQVLRRRFEISRSYHIAQLLFYWKKEYLSAMKLLKTVVIENAKRFIQEFGSADTVKE